MSPTSKQRRAASPAELMFHKDELVRWTEEVTDEGDERKTVTRHGLTIGETPGGLRVWVFDFERRNAFDLARYHLAWRNNIYALGRANLETLCELTWANAPEGTDVGTGEWNVTEEQRRPLDRLSAGALTEISDYVDTDGENSFLEILIGQLRETKDASLRQWRTKRLYGAVLPHHFTKEGTGWSDVAIWLLQTDANESGDPFALVEGYATTQALVLSKLYLPLLLTPQGGRKEYERFLRRREEFLIPSSREAEARAELDTFCKRHGDELLELIVYLLEMKSRVFLSKKARKALIDPGSWSPRIWEALVEPLRTAEEDDLEHALRDHHDMPYFYTFLETLAKARPDLGGTFLTRLGEIRGKRGVPVAWSDLFRPEDEDTKT